MRGYPTCLAHRSAACVPTLLLRVDVSVDVSVGVSVDDGERALCCQRILPADCSTLLLLLGVMQLSSKSAISIRFTPKIILTALEKAHGVTLSELRKKDLNLARKSMKKCRLTAPIRAFNGLLLHETQIASFF